MGTIPAGEPAATAQPAVTLAELYAEHHTALVRLGYLMSGSQAMAEDVVHDAFEKLAPRLGRIDSRPPTCARASSTGVAPSTDARPRHGATTPNW